MSSAQSAIHTTVSRAASPTTNLDVVGVGSAAAVVDDDDGLGRAPRPGSAGARRPPRLRPGRSRVMLDRLGDLGVAPDGDQRRGVERRKRLGRNTVGGTPPWPSRSSPRRTVSTVHAGRSLTVIFGAAGGSCRAVVQAAQPLERGEPPDLVAAVRNLEGVHVEGGEQLSLVVCDPFDALQSDPELVTSRPRLPSAARSAG